MALQIVKWGQQEKKLKVLIYWQPWVWKTRFACSAKKPLVFDVENWLGDVNLDRIEVKTVDQMLSQLAELAWTKDKLGYDTIIIDSLTAMRTNETISKKKFLRDDRGDLKMKGTKLLAMLRQLDMHVICICHEEIQELQKVTDDGNIYTDQFTYVPSLQGSIKKEINGFFDVVAYLSKDFIKGETIYTYDCEGKKNNVSKTRYAGINNETWLDFQARVAELNKSEKKKGKKETVAEVVSPEEKTRKDLAAAAWFSNDTSAEKIFNTITSKPDTDVEKLKKDMEASGKFDAEELATASVYIDSIVTHVWQQW